jgi:uncharacterized protein YyaL (SSP411 family)
VRRLAAYSQQMYRPEFRVVTGVLVVLTLLGLVSTALKTQIPPVVLNRLSVSNDEFLRRASGQAVDWRLLSTATLAESKRTAKPLLMLIGTSASGLVSRLDEEFFSDREIAAFLNRNYLCVRIDGMNRPEWLNAFFPVSRLKLEFLPGFQILVLTPGGEIVDLIGRTSNEQVFTRESLFDELIAVRRTFDAIESGRERARGEMVQKNDQAILESQVGFHLPAFDRYRAGLLDRIDYKHGGLPRNGLQQLFPSAWQYMLAIGDTDAVRASLGPLLTSPMVDLIDGGFFRLSSTVDFSDVEFNKTTTESAEMLTLLAQLSVIQPDPLHDYLTRLTYNALDTRLRVGDGTAAMQVEALKGTYRNERYSFSLHRMRQTLSPSQRTFARRFLGLDVLKNRQMSPFLVTPDVPRMPEFSDVVGRMRAEDQGPRNLNGTGYLEVEALVAARMIETCRLIGGTERTRDALQRVERLRQFVRGTGLMRQIAAADERPAYLGDYLAYADAKLQDYLVSGRVVSAEEGLRALVQAEKRFRGERPGEYRLVEGEMALPHVAMPEISDTFRESCTARMARLALHYGRMFETTQEGERLLAVADDIVGHFGAVASEGGPEVAAFFLVAADLVDGQYVVAVGPDAVGLATALKRKRPLRYIIPAIGTVRKDLQGFPPGLYLVRGGISGPLTLAEAARRLPPHFDVGSPAP